MKYRDELSFSFRRFQRHYAKDVAHILRSDISQFNFLWHLLLYEEKCQYLFNYFNNNTGKMLNFLK